MIEKAAMKRLAAALIVIINYYEEYTSLYCTMPCYLFFGICCTSSEVDNIHASKAVSEDPYEA